MTHPTEEMRTPPPRQRRRHPIARRIILISLALLVALVATFISSINAPPTNLTNM